MLTLMCPHCRHRFPAPGCCNTTNSDSPIITSTQTTMQSLECSGNYYSCGSLLVPRDFNSVGIGGCFINAPTIIHGPAIIQSNGQNSTNKIVDSLPFSRNQSDSSTDHQVKPIEETNFLKIFESSRRPEPECQINTISSCDLTGGTVTITTPNIQSGGCLIQSSLDSVNFVEAPTIEIRPKLSGGGGCVVQQRLSTDDLETNQVIINDNGCIDGLSDIKYCPESTLNIDNFILPPSGCQELPGIRRDSGFEPPSIQQLPPQCCGGGNVGNGGGVSVSVSGNSNGNSCSDSRKFDDKNDVKIINSPGCCCCGTRSSSNNYCHGNLSSNVCHTSAVASSQPSNSHGHLTNETITRKSSNTDDPTAVQIQVNATIQLPPNVGQCTVNITAMTNPQMADNEALNGAVRNKNHLNGGGLVQMDGGNSVIPNETSERREDSPTTPVSWLMPFPWGFDLYPQDKDMVKLAEIKRILQTSGWYHEGLNWQQSENILKNVSIGRWLMRDSSDSRYTFAISVQTNRGPTSVRVHYFFGQFRLDAEPRLVLAMPLFECPIKMLEYYVEYSRIEENRREVWVDYSGQLYSQIYLTKPLIKHVRPLSHLARLVVNKSKLNTDHLPAPIKNYLAEYPYSF